MKKDWRETHETERSGMSLYVKRGRCVETERFSEIFQDEIKEKVTIRKCVFPYLFPQIEKSSPCHLHGFFYTLKSALE